MADNIKTMQAVGIETILSEPFLAYDIFLALPSDKMLLIGRKGDPTPVDQLKRYVEKNVTKLYIRRMDFIHYKEIIDAKLTTIVDNPDIRPEAKISVLGVVAKKVFQDLAILGFSADVFDFARSMVDKAVSIVDSNLEIRKLLDAAQKIGDDFVAHGIATGAVSVMIAKAQGWEHEANIESLALGAMLHDIGLKSLPPELVRKPLEMLNESEFKVYKTHPAIGLKLMENIIGVPLVVASIAHEHHEYRGMGYPRGLRETSIQPFARLVSLADQFTEATISSASFPNQHRPERWLSDVVQKGSSNFRTEDINALTKIVLKRSA